MQFESLQCKIKNRNEDIIPLVMEYNPSLPNIGKIINKYWDLLTLSCKACVGFL